MLCWATHPPRPGLCLDMLLSNVTSLPLVLTIAAPWGFCHFNASIRSFGAFAQNNWRCRSPCKYSLTRQSVESRRASFFLFYWPHCFPTAQVEPPTAPICIKRLQLNSYTGREFSQCWWGGKNKFTLYCSEVTQSLAIIRSVLNLKSLIFLTCYAADSLQRPSSPAFSLCSTLSTIRQILFTIHNYV